MIRSGTTRLAPPCGSVRIRLPSLRGELPEEALDIGLGGIVAVEGKSPAERDRLPGRDDQLAGFGIVELLKVAFSENVGGDESVGALVPVGGVTGIPRIIEDRNAYRLTADFTVGIEPAGPFAPGFRVLDPLIV